MKLESLVTARRSDGGTMLHRHGRTFLDFLLSVCLTMHMPEAF